MWAKLKGVGFEGSLSTTKKLFSGYLEDYIELKAKERIYKEMLDKLHDREVEAKYCEVAKEVAHRKKVLEDAANWFEKAAKQIREVLKE